jgi:hypothetical protein
MDPSAMEMKFSGRALTPPFLVPEDRTMKRCLAKSDWRLSSYKACSGMYTRYGEIVNPRCLSYIPTGGRRVTRIVVYCVEIRQGHRCNSVSSKSVLALVTACLALTIGIARYAGIQTILFPSNGTR